MNYKIITDSASDLPNWVIEKYNLEVIPIPVIIDDKEFLDGKTVKAESFYDILKSGKEIKTCQINTFMYIEYFKRYAQNNESIIYICFTSGLTGTYSAACIAKDEILEEYPNFDITIIDSRCASLGFGNVVYRALLMQENGVDKDTVIESIKFDCKHMKHVFTVETLEYLYKGGRLSKTSAILGGMLDIKPIITVNEAGGLEAIEKVRGRNKSLKRLVQLVGEMGYDLENQLIGICHGDDYDTLKKVEKMLREQYNSKNFIESYVGCAIGAHTGAGIIGIVFLDAQSPYEKEILKFEDLSDRK